MGVNRGLMLGTTAYLIWGFMALYWIQVEMVSPQDMVVHRIVWSFPLLVLCLLWMGRLKHALRLFTQPRSLMVLFCSSVMQVANWGLFVWAVVNARNTETSLGYFLLPLINVAIGVTLFRERLDKSQWLAIAFAGVGLCILILENRGLPWVALGVAISFGLYGAIRKAVNVESVEGMFVEIVLVLPFGLAWLWMQQGAGLGMHGWKVDLFLIGAGLVTVVPLVCYVAASRMTQLSSLGLVFYLGPSCQLFVAVCIFGEPLNPIELFSFGLVWLGLAIVATAGLRRYRNVRALSDVQS